MGKLLFVNFNQLRSFFAVAQEMSFTKAARVLNIGQPTLTVQVRALEKTYDVELFHRTPRGLELTDIGVSLYRVTRQIFGLEEEAVEVLRAARHELSGKLRIGTVGPCFVMKLLSAFNNRYPLVQVTITSDNSDAVVQRVLDVELDVAVVGSGPEGPAPVVAAARVARSDPVCSCRPSLGSSGLFVAGSARRTASYYARTRIYDSPRIRDGSRTTTGHPPHRNGSLSGGRS